MFRKHLDWAQCFVILAILHAVMGQPAYAEEVLKRSAPADQRPSAKLQGDNRRGMGAQWGNEADVLSHVLTMASEAAERLQKRDVGSTTRELQRQIVAELDKLLSPTGASSAQRNPQPAPTPASPSQQAAMHREESTAQKPGTAQAGTQRRDDAVGNGATDDWRSSLEAIWGRLPPRDRPPVTQQTFESFIPKYRTLIESYYRELSRTQRPSIIPGQTPASGDRGQ
jgi:hypothetical protein